MNLAPTLSTEFITVQSSALEGMFSWLGSGAPGTIRTSDPQIRSVQCGENLSRFAVELSACFDRSDHEAFRSGHAVPPNEQEAGNCARWPSENHGRNAC